MLQKYLVDFDRIDVKSLASYLVAYYYGSLRLSFIDVTESLPFSFAETSTL